MTACRKVVRRAARDSRRRKWRGRRRCRCTLRRWDHGSYPGPRAVVRDPPALVLAGLAPDRVIYVEAGDEKAVLACFEEGLRYRKLGAVVAEVARLSMTTSRRLQLAAEGSGVIGLALRRWHRQAAAADFGQPTASTTRWRVSALPSTPLPVPGVGRARWGSICSGAAAVNVRSSKWRLAIQRVASLNCPRWPPDQVRSRARTDRAQASNRLRKHVHRARRPVMA
jgi:hypothetical protein